MNIVGPINLWLSNEKDSRYCTASQWDFEIIIIQLWDAHFYSPLRVYVLNGLFVLNMYKANII